VWLKALESKPGSRSAILVLPNGDGRGGVRLVYWFSLVSEYAGHKVCHTVKLAY
jgi:hypothetical protein